MPGGCCKLAAYFSVNKQEGSCIAENHIFSLRCLWWQKIESQVFDVSFEWHPAFYGISHTLYGRSLKTGCTVVGNLANFRPRARVCVCVCVCVLGYIFSSVCQEFCSRGGEYLGRAGTPPAGKPTLGQVHPPRSSACWEIRATSGRYASYWNHSCSFKLSVSKYSHPPNIMFGRFQTCESKIKENIFLMFSIHRSNICLYFGTLLGYKCQECSKLSAVKPVWQIPS